MKLKFLLFFLTASSILSGCSKPDIDKDTPHCIDKKIRDFKKTSFCPDAEVSEHQFQGSTVYVFDEGTCAADIGASVFDSDCNNIGYLGGFTGNTVINGENFSNAIFIRTLWEK